MTNTTSSDAVQRIVVIGAGLAGGSLADALRMEGFTGSITLIGEETWPPYQRPPLSKKFLSGEMTEDRLAIKPEAFYEKNDITVRLGTRVEAIDRANKQVVLTCGEKIPYDKLAITTGTRVRRIPVAGAELGGVLYSRGIDDIHAMRAQLENTQQVAIIGAGFIGLETAAVLRGMGKQVVVLEMMDRVMPRVVAPIVSQFYQQLHESHGVIIRTNVTVAGFEGDASGRIAAVRLGDGSTIPAQMAVVGIGVIPNAELAQAAGLVCDNGIAVDEHAQTSDPDIVAAGDVASHPNGFYQRRIRLESVHNAVEQTKTAAATLLGKLKVYEQYPWFWSDQYDKKLQMVGLSQGYNTTVVRGDIGSGTFSVFYFQDDRLLAVDSIARPADHMQARRILNNRIAITPAQASDTGCDLKELV
jgi:3-phenylpropionate/trans-cinnamate dioxygenase ferredoxin reductase subunit